MVLPVQISFRGVLASESVEAYVRRRAAKLATFHGRVTGCHVVVESPHRHRRHGRHYRVRVELHVPGGELVASHLPDVDPSSEDVYAAIDAAFDQLGRELEDRVRRQRGDVKVHDSPHREGRVAKLWSYEGFGFIETPEGDDVYFHRNSVVNGGFDRLAIGAPVRFVEEAGLRGPQASTVVRKRHVSPWPRVRPMVR